MAWQGYALPTESLPPPPPAPPMLREPAVTYPPPPQEHAPQAVAEVVPEPEASEPKPQGPWQLSALREQSEPLEAVASEVLGLLI